MNPADDARGDFAQPGLAWDLIRSAC